LAARILMVFSASIVLTLGVFHLVYTFWGPNLTPRDPALQISMSQISPGAFVGDVTPVKCGTSEPYVEPKDLEKFVQENRVKN
jgi:hypothetical protein